jgi:UDP-N-acetyl-D-mannosaminuronic acid dehydrogenase
LLDNSNIGLTIPREGSGLVSDRLKTGCARIEDSLLSFNKVLIIGLGQLGLPVAKYVKEQGFDTYGYDISQKAMQRAEKVASIKSADDFSEFDVYIVCVSTHMPDDMFTPQIEGLFSIVQDKIAKEAKNGALVSIESTIPRGTSKKVFEMLNHRLHVAHIPHRWYALEEKEHGVNQLRVVGGVCECCLKVAMQFYGQVNDNYKINNINININNNNINNNNKIDDNIISSSSNNSNNIISDNGTGSNSGTSSSRTTTTSGTSNSNYTPNLGIPLHPVSDIEIAEITKIAENAHRYLQIAFAEDMYLYCQANSINFPELREALNTKWNVEVLEPREGIGGHCLPKDTKMFLQSSRSISARSKILKAAIEVDEEYKRYRLSRTTQTANIQSTSKSARVSSVDYA